MTPPHVTRRGWWALVLAPLVLASCSSGSGPSTQKGATDNSSLGSAGVAVLAQIDHYLSAVQACKAGSKAVTCLEAADRTLGGRIHTYANSLATGHGFTAPAAELNGARDKAQTVANSLEILGDAQPTQANYNQVLNNFNLTSALDQLNAAVTQLDNDLSGG